MRMTLVITVATLAAGLMLGGAPVQAESRMKDDGGKYGRMHHHDMRHHKSHHRGHAMGGRSYEGAATGESGKMRKPRKAMRGMGGDGAASGAAAGASGARRSGGSCGEFMYWSGGKCMDARAKPAKS